MINDNSGHQTHNGYDINGIDDSSNDSNHSTVLDRSNSRSPIPNENTRLESSLPCKQELKVDQHMFHIFINKDIMKFWDNRNNLNTRGEMIDDGVIDLFSLLDKKVGQYLQKWDRSSLIMELKKEFEEFKYRYVKELNENE